MATFRIGHWSIDDVRWLATGPSVVNLSETEVGLLTYLREAKEPVSRAVLLQEVFGYAATARSRAADMGISRLRSKLEVDPKEPVWICSRRQVGVWLEGLEDDNVVVSSPRPAAPFGRAALVEDVTKLLTPESLVTLHGVPGIGKTHVARFLGASHPWVSSGCVTAADVRDALAVGLGVSRHEDVHGAMARCERVVLDQADTLDASGARAVGELGGTRLVTSTRPLGVAGEQVVSVPLLSLVDARELLARKAEQSGASTADVERVVNAVGGHPLALQILGPVLDLVGAVPVEAWLAVQSERVDVPLRHQSLHDALAPTWGQLSDSAVSVLCNLSFFRADFAFDAVGAVCGLSATEALGIGRELLRRGLLAREGGRLRVPPVVALFAQAQAGAGPQAVHRFLAKLYEVLFRSGPAKVAPYLTDLLAAVATCDDAQLAPIALTAEALGAPLEGQFEAVRSRSSEGVAELHRLSLLVWLERGLRARGRRWTTHLQTLQQRRDELTAISASHVAIDAMMRQELEDELIERAMARSHVCERLVLLPSFSRVASPDLAARLLEAALEVCDQEGWWHQRQNLEGAMVGPLVGQGRFEEAQLLTRSLDQQRVDSCDAVVAHWGAGLRDGALATARRYAVNAHRPQERARDEAILAAVWFLCGDAEQAVAAARGALAHGDGMGGAVFARLVLRGTGRSEEPVGAKHLDAALNEGTPYDGGYNSPGRLAAWVLEAVRAAAISEPESSP